MGRRRKIQVQKSSSLRRASVILLFTSILLFVTTQKQKFESNTKSAFSTLCKKNKQLRGGLTHFRYGPGATQRLQLCATESHSSSTDAERAKLTVVQITDVYMLDNFPHLKNLILEKRKENPNVISMLTGDFLSPYLLSTIDQGFGMMRMLNSVPIDYLTWGNHEADIAHSVACRHVREFQGKWLNSNMRSHDAMSDQMPYDVITVKSPDGSHERKVGLIAVLSDEADLYKHFKAPGPFGGARIDCPWETLAKYKEILQKEHGCDLIIPLQHLYVHQDHRTCRDFDFPVILSGHDHHRVDEVVDGTRLLKPGQDAYYATVLDLSWDHPSDQNPTITAEFAHVPDWPADEEMLNTAAKAYTVLDPLRHTELAPVPSKFRPLSSVGPRGRVTSMGVFICTLMRRALNSDRNPLHHVDAVILMGGNIRGGRDYPPDSFFSLEALDSEIKNDEVLGIVEMPGWLIVEGIKATRGEPKPGWFQYDDGIEEDSSSIVIKVAGEPVDLARTYLVATKIVDLTNGQSPPLTTYYRERPELIPSPDTFVNIHHALMVSFARRIWRRVWELADTNHDGTVDASEFRSIDLDGDGLLSREEIFEAIRRSLEIDVDDKELELADCILEVLDANRDGRVSKGELKRFADEEGLSIFLSDDEA